MTRAMGSDGDLVASRFARGCRCFAVSIDGAIAGYGWLSTGTEWIGEIQLEITPQPKQGYIWDCATLPAHRQKGVFRSLLVGISDIARGDGLKRLWIGTIAIPAEKALAPSGFMPALHFTSIRLGGWHVLRMRASSDKQLALEGRRILQPKADLLVRRVDRRRH